MWFVLRSVFLYGLVPLFVSYVLISLFSYLYSMSLFLYVVFGFVSSLFMYAARSLVRSLFRSFVRHRFFIAFVIWFVISSVSYLVRP